MLGSLLRDYPGIDSLAVKNLDKDFALKLNRNLKSVSKMVKEII